MSLIIVFVAGYLLLGTKKGRYLMSKLIAFLAKSSLKIIFYIAMALILLFLAVNVVKWIFNHVFLSILIAVLFLVIVIIIGAYQESKDKKIHSKIVEDWKKQPIKKFTDDDILSMLSPVANDFYESDTNGIKYNSGFPFGRVTYFMNFFDHDIQFEDPLYFSPIRSRNQDELREYGIIMTTAGIYISSQLNKTNNDGTSKSKDINIQMTGMVSSKIIGDTLYIDYVEYKDQIIIRQEYTTIPIQKIKAFCDMAICSGLSISLCNNEVYDYTAVLDEQETKFIKENYISGINKGVSAAGVVVSMPNMENVYNEVKYNMDQRNGHGIAAEYGNTVIDKVTGDRTAKHLGADNVLNGADRISHGIQLQCKYCQTARDTINAAFSSNHDYDYNKMKIEVPRDQYSEAVEILQKKIKNGDLANKGITDPNEAKNILRKGYLTYQQSLNVAKSGSIESLAIDTMQGVTCSIGAGSITALMTFANCIWNGMDVKDSAQKSLEIGAKTIGKSTFIFVMTMQLSRKNFINYFSVDKTASGAKKFGTISNPLYKIGDGLAKKISNSGLAKSTIGQKLGLSKISGRTIIGGGIAAAITFGPDIARALAGRISFKQLMKNSAIGASGIAGATIGQVLIPVPIVGAMIGGSVSSFIAKKTLDHFIEDDAIEMFNILKEEFIDLVTTCGLNGEEFNEVVGMTIAHKKLPSILRDMYAYGDARQYARDDIVSVALQYVFSKRQKITEEMYNDGIALLIDDTVAA